MSAEVESLMYVSNEENGRFVPWHGLGTPVGDALTSKEAIKVAGLDWEVKSNPIYTPEHIEIPGYKANMRETDNKVLGIVSNRYKIVQNSEAFDFTDNLIGKDCKYETAGSLCGGKKIFLLARLPERKILGDEVENYICFTNSHDGMGAIQACMTPVRVVCQNTLNLALSSASRKWSTRHTGDIESKLEEAKHTLELANDYMNELEVVADKLANTTMKESDIVEIIDDVFHIDEDATARMKQNMLDKRNQFMICMLAPDIAKFQNTAWGLVNAASDFATHSTPNRKTSSFQENRFNGVLNGDVVIDKVFAKILANKSLKLA